MIDMPAPGRTSSTIVVTLCLLALSGPVASAAQQDDWRRYVVPETGANVDLPRGIFNSAAGKPETGYGAKFLSPDGRASLSVQSMNNAANDTPSTFLAKKNPPSNIVYRRITPNFFVVSSFRGSKIWYDRCNFAGRLITCVLLNYPASEKRQWDNVVTRISHSLSNG